MTGRELVELLGPQMAWEVAKAFGGGIESIPTLKSISTACRQMAITIASARGMATQDIAIKLDINEETVIRIIKAQLN